TKEATLAVYSQIGWITLGVSVVVLALSPFVKRWMHLDTLDDDQHRSLAGRATLAENQAPGMFPQDEERAPGDPRPSPRS
ncbi:MAG: hypothetical protein M3438_03645, partial [Pseudomonadota bacterium]|nr:hypothetical protein [Pseudomonadota bacterium]